MVFNKLKALELVAHSLNYTVRWNQTTIEGYLVLMLISGDQSNLSYKTLDKILVEYMIPINHDKKT